LLLITNRKWHTLGQIRRESLTLDDLEGRYTLLWLNSVRWQPVWSAFPSDSWASCCN